MGDGADDAREQVLARMEDEPDAPICDFCDDADATWVIDKDMTHGGGEDGPEWDAPVYRVACDGCKSKSSYMEPEVLTPEWRRRLRI